MTLPTAECATRRLHHHIQVFRLIRLSIWKGSRQVLIRNSVLEKMMMTALMIYIVCFDHCWAPSHMRITHGWIAVYSFALCNVVVSNRNCNVFARQTSFCVGCKRGRRDYFTLNFRRYQIIFELSVMQHSRESLLMGTHFEEPCT